MSRAGPEGGIDDRLKHLLAIEQRLQDAVRAAEADAAARVAKAREAADRLRVEAEAGEARRAAEEDAEDRAAHAEALSALSARSTAALDTLKSIPDRRIDELARMAIDRAIGPPRGRP